MDLKEFMQHVLEMYTMNNLLCIVYILILKGRDELCLPNKQSFKSFVFMGNDHIKHCIFAGLDT